MSIFRFPCNCQRWKNVISTGNFHLTSICGYFSSLRNLFSNTRLLGWKYGSEQMWKGCVATEAPNWTNFWVGGWVVLSFGHICVSWRNSRQMVQFLLGVVILYIACTTWYLIYIYYIIIPHSFYIWLRLLRIVQDFPARLRCILSLLRRHPTRGIGWCEIFFFKTLSQAKTHREACGGG